MKTLLALVAPVAFAIALTSATQVVIERPSKSFSPANVPAQLGNANDQTMSPAF